VADRDGVQLQAREPVDTGPAGLSPHTTYRDGLAAGRLLFQRCPSCRAAVFPPRLVCPSCGGTQLATEESAGAGTVYSTTAVTRRDAPSYSVCLVDLDEGFRMMSTVTDLPAESVPIGLRVRFVAERGDQPRPTFVAEATS
jgi:uncharacterized OB-fold protein